MNDSQSLSGYVLVSLLCALMTCFSATELWKRLRSGKAVDRTLSEVDNPLLFYLQVLSFVLLTGGCGLISVAAFGMVIRTLFGQP
jgi:hypothetical protein